MSNEIRITVVGRLVEDPSLRFTPSGAAVANVSIASNARRFDRNTNEWKDEPATFWRGSIWREAAENVAESLQKGTAVIATGVVKSREYEKDGQKRTALELDIEAIGPDLRWATAKVEKAQRQGGQFGGQPAAKPDDQWAAPPAQGGWGSQPPKGGAGWAAPATDEPPFFAPPNVIGW